MIRRFLLLTAFCLLASSAYARSRFQGYVERPGAPSLGGILYSAPLDTRLQRAFPGALVTVYTSGTLTPAVIYSDLIGTVKANPFAADSAAFWSFYADASSYDIKFTPSTVPSWTLSINTLSASTDNVFAPAVICDGVSAAAANATAINAAFASASAVGGTVVLPSGVCLVSSGLTITNAIGLRVNGTPSKFDVTSPGTTLKASSAMDAVLTISGMRNSVISGIRLDAGRLANYGVKASVVAWNDFTNCNFINAKIDGAIMTATVLETQWSNCHFSGNGVTYATAGIIAQYTNGLGASRSQVTGTAATTASNTTIVFTGAPDLTTLGIRRGDHIRVGPGNSWQVAPFQIDSVTPTTVVLQPGTDNIPTSTVAGLDYAIGVGDGYHEQSAGDISVNVFINCRAFYNGGSGMRFCGLYGPTVIGGDTSYNNFYGRSVSMSDFIFSMVQGPSFDNVYSEFNAAAQNFMGNSSGFNIIGHTPSQEPVASGYRGATGTLLGPNGAEDLTYGLNQSFIIGIRNNAGTLERIFTSDWLTLASPNITRISGFTSAWTAIPTVDAGTPFAGGVGIYNGAINVMLFDSPNAQTGRIDGSETLLINSTATVVRPLLSVVSLNVNGTTKPRLSLRILDSTGAQANWSTAVITAGTTMAFRINVKMR